MLDAEALYHLPAVLPGVGSRFYELDRGTLCVREPGGLYHGSAGVKISAALLHYVEVRRLGVVVGADVGFVLQRNPDTVLSPDVAFIRTDRVPTAHAALRFFEGAPDLAVEVMSPSDRWPAVAAKASRYLQAGSRLVWVVDPPRRTVTVYRPDTAACVLNGGETLEGREVIPGFRMLVDAVFPTFP